MLGVDAADEEPATVDVQDRGGGTVTGLRRVHAHGHVGRARRSGDRAVVDFERRRVDVRSHRRQVLVRELPRGDRVGGCGVCRHRGELGQLGIEGVGHCRIVEATRLPQKVATCSNSETNRYLLAAPGCRAGQALTSSMRPGSAPVSSPSLLHGHAVDDRGAVATLGPAEALGAAGHVGDELVVVPVQLVEREHHEVGGVAFGEHPAVVEPERRGLAAGELVHRVLEREVAAVADVAGEQQRRVARRAEHLHVRARVRRADEHLLVERGHWRRGRCRRWPRRPRRCPARSRWPARSRRTRRRGGRRARRRGRPATCPTTSRHRGSTTSTMRTRSMRVFGNIDLSTVSHSARATARHSGSFSSARLASAPSACDDPVPALGHAHEHHAAVPVDAEVDRAR